MVRIVFSCLVCSSLLVILIGVSYCAQGKAEVVKPFPAGPTIGDANLNVETVFKNKGGLKTPVTGIAFLGPDDILILEKNKGTVKRLSNGKLSSDALLRVNVGKEVEWGMLSIAVSKIEKKTYVFLYYTESKDKGGNHILGNRLYRYEFKDNRLQNPSLLLDLPAKSLEGTVNDHVAGKVVIGPDKNIYISIGDVGGRDGQSQNNKTGAKVDGTSGILRVTPDGKPIGDGILGKSDILRLYYAYGIRNSFGFDFDPITKNMWDTENGFHDNDEINLVAPGFNSGWKMMMGIAPKGFDTRNLVDFNGNGNYSNPEFVWNQTVGPTDLKFLDSDKLGRSYKNTIFIGDFNNGYLYNFKLDKERSALLLDENLTDHIANTLNEAKNNIFAKGFGVITDLEVGPDGYLYILGYDGSIYRIVRD